VEAPAITDEDRRMATASGPVSHSRQVLKDELEAQRLHRDAQQGLWKITDSIPLAPSFFNCQSHPCGQVGMRWINRRGSPCLPQYSTHLDRLPTHVCRICNQLKS
jgi:hypothetical protein